MGRAAPLLGRPAPVMANDEVVNADREVRSSLARIERDVDRLDRKVDSFLTQHAAKHDTEQQSFNAHLLAAGESMSRSARNESQISSLDTRVESVESWRSELRGAMNLMRLALGTSILSAIVTVFGLIGVLVNQS